MIMLVVIPVSRSDFKRADALIAVFKKFGGCKSHKLLVVSRHSENAFAFEVESQLRGLFGESDCFIFNNEGSTGWPMGANFYFQETVRHLKETDNRLPWLWMELDATPLKEGWLDAISNEYAEVQSPFLGVLNEWNELKWMDGVGVYPPNFHEYCPHWDSDLPKRPFDFAFRDQIVPHAQASKYIQHCFRTQNYSVFEGGKIKGEHAVEPEIGRRDDFINPETVLLHGCSDGSLAKMIASAERKHQITQPNRTPVYIQQPKSASTYIRTSISALLKCHAVCLDKYETYVVIQITKQQEPIFDVFAFVKNEYASFFKEKRNGNRRLSMEWDRYELFFKHKINDVFCVVINATERSRREDVISILHRIISRKPHYFSFIENPFKRVASMYYVHKKIGHLRHTLPSIDEFSKFMISEDSEPNYVTKLIVSYFGQSADHYSGTDEMYEFATQFINQNIEMFTLKNVNAALSQVFCSIYGKHMNHTASNLGDGKTHIKRDYNTTEKPIPFNRDCIAIDVLEKFDQLHNYDLAIFRMFCAK